MITAAEARKNAEYAQANKFETSEIGKAIFGAIHSRSLHGQRSVSFNFCVLEDSQHAKNVLEDLGFNVMLVVKNQNSITLNISW